MLTLEGLTLIGRGFQPAILIEVVCPSSGCYRVCLPEWEQINGKWACPHCHQKREAGHIEATILTTRPLPFHEKVCGKGNFHLIKDSEFDEPSRVCLPGSRESETARDAPGRQKSCA